MQHYNLHSPVISSKPVVLFDSDGILTDLSSKWVARYNADYGDSLSPEQITAWAMHEFTKQECGYRIYDYLLEPGFFRDLEPIAGAQEGLRYLSEFIEPVVVTTVPGVAAADRIANLRELYPFVPADNIILTSRKDLVKGKLLVEDAPKNVTHDRRFFLLKDYPYNRQVSKRNVERVYTWVDIVDRVQSLYHWGYLYGTS